MLISALAGKAQSTQFNGEWALCKTVNAKGDTTLVSAADKNYVTYAFTYNNTFTSFRNEKKDDELSGRWGYEFKTKTIKLKKPVYAKSKEALADQELVIDKVTDKYFVEVRKQKKESEYFIYCRKK